MSSLVSLLQALQFHKWVTTHNPSTLCVCVDFSKEWTVSWVMFFFISRLKITSTVDGHPFQLCPSDVSCLPNTNCRLFYKFLVICCRELVMQSLQICRPLLDYVSIAIFLILFLLMVLLVDWYVDFFSFLWFWVLIDLGLFADSSFVPPLIYSILGSSRHLAVGPVSIASLVMGTMLNNAVSHTEDPILYLKLAFTATFVAGLFQASLGLLRYWTIHIKFPYRNILPIFLCLILLIWFTGWAL